MFKRVMIFGLSASILTAYAHSHKVSATVTGYSYSASNGKSAFAASIDVPDAFAIGDVVVLSDFQTPESSSYNGHLLKINAYVNDQNIRGYFIDGFAPADVGPTSASATISDPCTVHGKVINPAGAPLTSGVVKFTTDIRVPEKDQKFLKTVSLDETGSFSANGLAPGNYIVYIESHGKRVDHTDGIFKIKAGENKTLDFNMTRPSYLKELSPAELQEVEEYKKKTSAALARNKAIVQFNETLKAVQADLAAAAPAKGDVSKDVGIMKNAVSSMPEEPLVWTTYGSVLLAQADHLAALDNASGKVVAGDDLTERTYADTVEAYRKAISLYAASDKPNATAQAADYNQLGNALARAGRGNEAIAAFENAAKAAPANADLYYRNEAVVLYNLKQFGPAAEAADRAIAADPNDAKAYYVKLKSLMGAGRPAAQAGEVIAPRGIADACEHFLRLAPNDPQAGEVRKILATLGEQPRPQSQPTP